MNRPHNEPYRSRFNHDDRCPVNERCDMADHSMWRIEQVGPFIGPSAVVAAAEALLRGELPRRRAGDPGE